MQLLQWPLQSVVFDGRILNISNCISWKDIKFYQESELLFNEYNLYLQ